MALLNMDDRISVKPFASIPALTDLGLPEVKQSAFSISGMSSESSGHSSKHGAQGISLEEGCMITKSIRYTHQLIHWVNTASSVDPAPIEAMIERGLRITPDSTFTLNDLCNLAFLEPFVHASLDVYAFIALSPSLPTVNSLIDNVRSDNDHRQNQMNRRGKANRRSLDFTNQAFTRPEYELVILHPEHFLPDGGIFTVYNHANNHENYVVSADRCLRTNVDANSAQMPPFNHDTQQREDYHDCVNVFLVAINAEIKFRRYFRMLKVQQLPALPQDIIKLMEHVMELVDLLYWEPVPASKESVGEGILAPPDTQKRSERLLEEHRWLGEWRSMDFETRRAYGTAMMCGHDKDYDPALFEDSFPVNDEYEAKPVYSAKDSVEAWRKGIVPEDQIRAG